MSRAIFVKIERLPERYELNDGVDPMRTMAPPAMVPSAAISDLFDRMNRVIDVVNGLLEAGGFERSA